MQPMQPNPQPSLTPQPFDSLHWLKILSIVLAAVLLLTTVGLGAYFFGKNQTKPTSQITQTTPTPITDPTANWKTYKYSLFSIKVPREWQAGESNTKDFTQLKLQLEPNNTLSKTEIYTEKTSQDLESYVEKRRQDAKEFSQAANALSNYKADWKLIPTKIDNQPAIKVQDFEAYPSNVSYYVKDPTKKWSIIIAFYDFGSNTNSSEIFDKILSTFKFSD